MAGRVGTDNTIIPGSSLAIGYPYAQLQLGNQSRLIHEDKQDTPAVA